LTVDRPLRILAVSSSGGVLLDLLALHPWFSRHQVVWAAVPAVDTEATLAEEDVHWMDDCPASAPLSVVRRTMEAFAVVSAERPDVIVSAGTGLAVGFFVVARLRRVPSFWLDTLNVVERPGRVARLCAVLASRTLVQRRSLLGRRPRAVFVGELY
jgi:hypothetical protein